LTVMTRSLSCSRFSKPTTCSHLPLPRLLAMMLDRLLPPGLLRPRHVETGCGEIRDVRNNGGETLGARVYIRVAKIVSVNKENIRRHNRLNMASSTPPILVALPQTPKAPKPKASRSPRAPKVKSESTAGKVKRVRKIKIKTEQPPPAPPPSPIELIIVPDSPPQPVVEVVVPPIPPPTRMANGLAAKWAVIFQNEVVPVLFHSVRDISHGLRSRGSDIPRCEKLRAFLRRRQKPVEPSPLRRRRSAPAWLSGVKSISRIGHGDPAFTADESENHDYASAAMAYEGENANDGFGDVADSEAESPFFN
jgi:hypothetical protein